MRLLLPLLLLACSSGKDVSEDDTDTTETTDDTTDSTDTTDTTDSTDTTDTTDTTPAGEAPAVCINEYMSSNTGSLRLPDGTAPDWIELHNPTDAAIDLTGWWLTDDPAVPDKFVLPTRTLRAGGYLMLYADDDVEDGPDHVSFSLDAAGETLVLTDPQNHQDVVETTPAAAANFAYARTPDCCVGDCMRAISDGTPGATNGSP